MKRDDDNKILEGLNRAGRVQTQGVFPLNLWPNAVERVLGRSPQNGYQAVY